MSYTQDISDYIGMVMDDKEYKHPRFIPIALPRRFGKTTIASYWSNVPGVIVVDDLNKVECEEFMEEILPKFREKNVVLVALFTPQCESHFTSKFITDDWSSFHGKLNVNDHVFNLKFPDGSEKSYPLTHVSVAKESEIHTIYQLFC